MKGSRGSGYTKEALWLSADTSEVESLRSRAHQLAGRPVDVLLSNTLAAFTLFYLCRLLSIRLFD